MRHPTLPWDKIDPLLKAGVRSAEISRQFGCTMGTLSHRKSRLGVALRWKKATKKEQQYCVPFIPPADRLDRALKAKARNLGQPLEWMRSVWLRGEAGREFLREY